jgi:hypothetical protein
LKELEDVELDGAALRTVFSVAFFIKETLITFVCALSGAFLRPTASMSLNAATAAP